MESVQTMRWILVNATAVAAVIALALGYVVPGIILLFGVFLHGLHWWVHKQGLVAPAEQGEG